MKTKIITTNDKIFHKNKNKICKWIESLGYDPNEVYELIIICGLEETEVGIRRYKTDNEGRCYLTDNDEIATKEPVFIEVEKIPDFLKEE
ncbi:MAG: hypothetical protein ACQEQD_04520 [Bacillota bacterium]